ncbi:MAG: OmpA family protein [bacterium]
MRKILIALVIVSISLLSNWNSEVRAEKPIFSVGAYTDYNLSFHSADFKKIADCPNCSPGFTSGTGSGFSLGGIFELPINNVLNFDIRLGYTTLPGTLTTNNEIGNVEVIDEITGLPKTIQNAVSEYVIDSKFAMIGLEPEIVWSPINRLRLSGMLRFGFLTTATFSQHETLIRPDNIIFKDTESKTRNVINDTIVPFSNNFQMQLGVGVGYEIPIGTRLRLIPEARMYFGLTKLSKETWNANGLQLGAALLWDIYPPKVKETVNKEIINRDTTVKLVAGLKKPELSVTDTKVTEKTEETDDYIIKTKTTNIKYQLNKPQVVNLVVDFKTYGLYKDGSKSDNPTIRIEEIESAELFPLLPYVFFKENSSDIQQSGLKLLTKDEAEKFTETGLEWDIMSIYSQMLNIIADRLRHNPKAEITITGTNKDLLAEKNNTALSTERAYAVKKYLTEIFEIDPIRIKVQARNLPSNLANNEYAEGQQENQRAELYSKNYEIIKPIELKDIIKSINPPILEIVPQVQSDAKIKNWNYTISQGGEQLRTYKGTGEVEKQEWLIANRPIPLTEDKIDVVLTVENEFGTIEKKEKQSIIDQITIKEKRFELKDDKRIERFSLILFDYDKAQLKPEHETILKHIKSRIEPNSKVIISGYADRTGSTEYNKELATKRTNVVNKFLGAAPEQVVINNIGSDELLYENNSPEGRSYCRTVIITIETPVK